MSKSIVINTDYLSTRKSRSGGGEKPPRNTTLKPNKIKQALINRIKTYHSELLNKDRIESEKKVEEQPKNEFDESVELFNQMSREKEKKDERRKLRFSANLSRVSQPATITQSATDTLPSPAYLEEARTRKRRQMEMNHNHTVKITSNDIVPYGILKGGIKPTYRQFSRTTQPIEIKPVVDVVNEMHVVNEMPAVDVVNEMPAVDVVNVMPAVDEVHERSKRLKKRLHDNGTRRIQKKVKKHRTLGKYKGKISVLVKNYETRRKIEKECAILKQTPMGVVKDFLRERGFIKMGSSAPDHILRQTYESCFLSGDVNNLNGENLVHNYLNES